MSKKWYFRTLIATLGLLVVVQQQAVVPNQEIVLEFVDIEISSPEAQNAITIVKEQLQSIGVQHTRISRGLKNGKLKITYYSDEDVAYIKRILSTAPHVALDDLGDNQNEDDSNEFPLGQNSKDYKLDVYKIQESTDFRTDFNAKYVLEIQQEQNGFSGSNHIVLY